MSARRTRLNLNTSLIALLATGALIAPNSAFAIDAGTLPENGTVVGGTATFDYSTPNTLNVNQNTDRVVINWDSFNIGTNATTQFFQPNSNSLAVNRVIAKGTDPTQILGHLSANGKVIVLDRNGVIFGKDSVIDVGGIVASTGDVSTSEVMSGANKIQITNLGDGDIVNNGTINAADAGLVGFVGKTAVNNGVINAKLGRVELDSGEKATVDLYGDGLIEIAADSNLEKAIVKNNGTINAEGGTVKLTAAAAKSAVDNVVNMDGVINVSSVSVQGGKIVLSAGNGNAVVSGKLDASGTTGGSVSVTGKNTIATDTADISADGKNGKGGTAYLYGDNVAVFEGTLSARGTGNGSGGAAEISGGEGVGFGGLVDLSAENGSNGTLLIDPKTLNINNNPTSGVIADILSGGIGTVNVNAQAIANTLRFTDVNLWATQDLNVTSDIDLSTWNGLGGTHGITSNDLTLAAPTLNLSNDIVLGTGNLNLFNMPAGTTVAFGLITVPAGGVNVDTVNLNGEISTRSTLGGATTLAGDTQLNSEANTVNVQSDAATIQQGLYLVKNAGGTVNVAAGNYDGGIVVDKAVTLNGTGANHTSKVTVPTNGDGFLITGDNVNLFGFGITGSGNPASTDKGIHIVGADNVKIGKEDALNTSNFGNDIRNLQYGIYVEDHSSNINLTKNYIEKIRKESIFANGVDGTTGHPSLVIFRNHINSGFTGIRVRNSDYAQIEGNVVDNQTLNAINVSGSDGVHVLRNTMKAIGNDGLLMDTSANALVQNNAAYNIGVDGFNITTSDGLQLLHNFAGANTLGVAQGIQNVKHDGFHISNSNNIVIYDNTAKQLGNDGIYVTHSNNVTIGKETPGNPSLFSNLVSDAKNGIYVDTGKNVNIIKNNVENISKESIFARDIDGTLGSPSLVVFRNHVNNGFTGIRVRNADYAQVEGNVVDNQKLNGINISGSNGVHVLRNTVKSAGNDGFLMDTSADALVQNNVAYKIGNDAFNITSADNLQLLNNFAGTDTSGVEQGVDNVKGDGFDISASNKVSILGNLAKQIVSAGIRVTGSNGVTIGQETPGNSSLFSNNIWNSGYGIYVQGGSDVNITKNYTQGIDNDGIFANNVNASGKTAGLTIFRNHTNLGATGIDVTGGESARIEGNVVDNQSVNGINVAGNSGLTMLRNNVHNITGNGLVVSNSGNALLQNNTAYKIGGDAYNISSSDGVSLLTNYAGSILLGASQGAGNVGNGFVFDNTNNLTLTGNRSIDAKTNGMLVSNSDAVTLNLNTLINSGVNGLDVQGGGNGSVVLTGNTFTNNATGARFESGDIDLTGAANTFNGGTVGMMFSVVPSLGSFTMVNDTIGTTIFNGQSQYYVQLDNGAMFNPGSPTTLDGTFASFDGFTSNSVGNVLTQAQYDQLENAIYHFNDDGTLGLFFFGSVPVSSLAIEQADIFRQIDGVPGLAGRFSITIRGLPRLPGVNGITPPTTLAANGTRSLSLNDITPAAGGDEKASGSNNQVVASNTVQNIEPAAGATNSQSDANNKPVSCWGDAIAAASSGQQSVTYGFDGGGADALAIGGCANR